MSKSPLSVPRTECLDERGWFSKELYVRAKRRKVYELFRLKSKECKHASSRIRILRIFADYKFDLNIHDRESSKAAPHRRRAFDKDKDAFRKYGKCWACRINPPTDRHHVVPLKNGGSNHGTNVVSLCRDCHAEVHPWMKRKAG